MRGLFARRPAWGTALRPSLSANPAPAAISVRARRLFSPARPSLQSVRRQRPLPALLLLLPSPSGSGRLAGRHLRCVGLWEAGRGRGKKAARMAQSYTRFGDGKRPENALFSLTFGWLCFIQVRGLLTLSRL
jgi:hypothetical protein